MKTDVIKVSSRGSQFQAALDQADKVRVYKELSTKNAMHLRLLTEEMMGLMRSIVGETEGSFWIEDQDNVYELHLKVTTSMTSDKRDQLLATATSGKNESAKGLMGRLRDFFDRGADEDIATFSSPLMVTGMYNHSANWEWSMMRYEDALADRMRQNDTAAREAWDELEKSVVAKVANDVKVSIKGREVELTIVKNMA